MKRIIGLDLGTKTLGVAISDSLGIAAHGYENFRFNENGFKSARVHVHEICKKENVSEIALGYPLNMDGSTSEHSKMCERFKEDLINEDSSLKITLVDERMTTMIANSRLLEANLSREKRKKVIDQQSAVVILETYMSARR